MSTSLKILSEQNELVIGSNIVVDGLIFRNFFDFHFFARINSITLREYFLKILRSFDNRKCITIAIHCTMVMTYLFIFNKDG